MNEIEAKLACYEALFNANMSHAIFDPDKSYWDFNPNTFTRIKKYREGGIIYVPKPYPRHNLLTNIEEDSNLGLIAIFVIPIIITVAYFLCK